MFYITRRYEFCSLSIFHLQHLLRGGTYRKIRFLALDKRLKPVANVGAHLAPHKTLIPKENISHKQTGNHIRHQMSYKRHGGALCGNRVLKILFSLASASN